MSKSTFSNRIGFVLAAAGSAVGLGNIWRFPFLAAEYGGGIFLLTYLAVTLIFGFPVMAMEISIGRKTGAASLIAYGKLDRRGSFIGALTAVVTLITLPYYCVIGGWVLKYAVMYLTGSGTMAAGEGYFAQYTSQTLQPVGFQTLFLLMAAAILLCGVKNGIEKANRFLMPALIALAVIVAGYTLTLDGAFDGVAYYLTPDWSRFSFKTVLAATGQMFYSLSLASGIMVTFGSYLKKGDSIERSVKQIELFDLGIAFISGLIVIPAVFAVSGGEGTALSAGTGLLFETLPSVFAAMPFGGVVGALVFVLIFFAAISSAISMMEVNVANLIARFGLKRSHAVLIMTVILLILGVPSSLGYGVWSMARPFGMSILDFFDYIGNSIVTPIVAMISCIFIGWIIKPRVLSEEMEQSGRFKRRRSFEFIIKWIAPLFIAAVLIGSLLEI